MEFVQIVESASLLPSTSGALSIAQRNARQGNHRRLAPIAPEIRPWTQQKVAQVKTNNSANLVVVASHQACRSDLSHTRAKIAGSGCGRSLSDSMRALMGSKSFDPPQGNACRWHNRCLFAPRRHRRSRLRQRWNNTPPALHTGGKTLRILSTNKNHCQPCRSVRSSIQKLGHWLIKSRKLRDSCDACNRNTTSARRRAEDHF